MGFAKLVRYEHNGETHYGNLESSNDGFTITKLNGDLETGFTSSQAAAITVPKLLCPLEKTPIIICIGLNYRKHATEANLSIPTYPVTFTKPADALTGPTSDVHVHPDAQEMLDYEGELTFVINRDAKNVTESDALDYVLGYTAGNDLSARNYQLPEASGGQFCYAKSFDGFAPVGPAIWSTELIPDPQSFRYVTKVNGEVRQETATEDMIWSVRKLVAHLSRGTTLRKGTLVMTGTPPGVGFFQKKFLKDGDVVEVTIEGLGGITNKVIFD